MDITANAINANINDSIERMNELLKANVDTQINFEKKMLKTNVISSIPGLGDNIDTYS
jgi:hypothetical protein